VLKKAVASMKDADVMMKLTPDPPLSCITSPRR
jgi:hypothetical protein